MEKVHKQKKGKQLVFDRKVYVHLPMDQYHELVELCQATNFRTMGELFRHIMDRKPLVAKYYENGPDPILEEMVALKMELTVKVEAIHRISRNCYIQQDPAAFLLDAKLVATIYQELYELLLELNILVKEVADRWITE